MQPSPETTALYEAAADWLARRSLGDWSPEDDRRFQEWLDASPEHGRIYERMAATWASAQDLPRAPHAAGLPGAAGAAPSRAAFRRPARLAFACAIACISVLAVAWQLHVRSPVYTERLATEAGQTRSVLLPDGTRIELNRATALDVAMYRDRREVRLAYGEAFFSVAPDAAKPFSVAAGGPSVTVVGTAFGVRRSASLFSVQVLQGVVQVDDGAGRPARLTAGGAYLKRAGRAGSAIARADGAAGAWRSGRLVFRDAPLDQVLDELSTYLPAPAVLGDPALYDLRVSGNADTAAADVFLRQLPNILPVQVRQRPDGAFEVGRRQSVQ